MPWTPSRLTKAQLEERRTCAFEILDTGFSPAEIALDLGVARQTAYEWKAVFDTHGMAGAKAKPHPGPGTNISAEQLEEFKTMIL
jgi:putative transposase